MGLSHCWPGDIDETGGLNHGGPVVLRGLKCVAGPTQIKKIK